jgi:topoisomerase-4 subunit A
VAVASLPSGRGDGAPVTSLIELEAGTQPAHYFAGGGSEVLLLANTGGFGLLARASDLVSRQRGGKGFLVLEDGAKPLPPAIVGSSASRVACLTLAGRLLVFGVDELKLQANGGRGLTLIDVDGDDPLVSVAAFGDALRVLGSGRAGSCATSCCAAPRSRSTSAAARARAGASTRCRPRPGSSPPTRSEAPSGGHAALKKRRGRAAQVLSRRTRSRTIAQIRNSAAAQYA